MLTFYEKLFKQLKNSSIKQKKQASAGSSTPVSIGEN